MPDNIMSLSNKLAVLKSFDEEALMIRNSKNERGNNNKPIM